MEPGAHTLSDELFTDNVRTQREAAFRRARRHSALVRGLRALLPLVAVLVIALMVFAAKLVPGEQFDFTLAKTTIGPNGITMENPKITGSDDEGREYQINASRAFQSLLSPDEIQLNDIVADIQFPDRAGLSLSAGQGDLDNNKSTLILSGGILAHSADGYELRLDSAELDFQDKTLRSGTKPDIHYKDSSTIAEKLSVEDSGQTIILEGKVRTIIMPPNRNKEQNVDP